MLSLVVTTCSDTTYIARDEICYTLNALFSTSFRCIVICDWPPEQQYMWLYLEVSLKLERNETLYVPGVWHI